MNTEGGLYFEKSISNTMFLRIFIPKASNLMYLDVFHPFYLSINSHDIYKFVRFPLIAVSTHVFCIKLLKEQALEQSLVNKGTHLTTKDGSQSLKIIR